MAAKKQYDLGLMKKMYLSGMSLRAICKKYGPSYGYLSSVCSQEKWSADKTAFKLRVQNAEQDAQLKELKDNIAVIRETDVAPPDEHVRRSMQAGDKLGELIQCGIDAVRSSDGRGLKTAVETWQTWDNQMRKNHGIDSNEEQPQVSINVMASLPSLKEVKARTAAIMERREKEALELDDNTSEATP